MVNESYFCRHVVAGVRCFAGRQPSQVVRGQLAAAATARPSTAALPLVEAAATSAAAAFL